MAVKPQTHRFETALGEQICAFCDLGPEQHPVEEGVLRTPDPRNSRQDTKPLAVAAKLMTPETPAGSSAPVPDSGRVLDPAVATGDVQVDTL